MGKTIVSSVKGTRDFYPEEMAFRKWLYGKIQDISKKFGYVEFDGPNIEYLDLYSDKTSEEILKEQAFSLKDRDGRDILLRPEITPTFARMVAAKAAQLPKPIRWYSFGRAYRYEQPQKGREREFFQWEINILGPETPEADAEIIAIAVEYFKELGLTSEEVVIRVSDRSYFDSILEEIGIKEKDRMGVIRLMDRSAKMSPDEFAEKMGEIVTNEQVEALRNYINDKDYTKSPWLKQVFKSLESYPGVLDYVEYTPAVVRGFDYYTRTVFEAFGIKGTLKRSLFGGGRFDNLTETLGGERVPGVGMAPGDVPIQVLLEELGKMPSVSPDVATVLVTVFSPELMEKSLEISSLLRSNDISVESWVDKDSKLEKQLKYADTKGIPFVVIIGPDEAESGNVVLKDLRGRTQETLSVEELLQKFIPKIN